MTDVLSEFNKWKETYTEISKSIDPLEELYLNDIISEEIFEKARTGKYADTAENRRLKRVGQEYGKKKGEDTKEEKEGKKEPETDKKDGAEKSIEEHARNASEQSLINASKGGDEEHRKAAKAELDRREKEESPKKENKEGDSKEQTSPIDELNEKIEGELNNQDNPLNEANSKIEEADSEESIRVKLKDIDSKLSKIEDGMKDKLEGLSFLQKAKVKSENKQYSSLVTLREELRGNLINVVEKQKESKKEKGDEEKNKKIEEDMKTSSKKQIEQFNIIQKTNPMLDDYHVGIRSPKDIKEFSETIKDDESFAWGDFSIDDAKKALKTGEVTIYSSKPIKQGNFISTSKIQAEQYSGGGKLYSKKVKLEDVAWINGDEGQFASLSQDKEDNNKQIEKSNKYEKWL